jgi:hypothetical protein
MLQSGQAVIRLIQRKRRLYLAPACLRGGHKTGAHGVAIDKNRASPAITGIATHLGVTQSNFFAKDIT